MSEKLRAASGTGGRPCDAIISRRRSAGSPGELPNWGETFAGATLATLPLLIVFVFLQKYFVRGMVMSGIKG